MSKRIIYDKRNNCAYIPELSVSRDFAAALAIELYNKLNITKSEAVEIFESFGYCIRENDEQDYIIRKSLNLQ